jgi:P-type Ca2+ transporter type 2C
MASPPTWHALAAEQVVAAMGSDAARGLSVDEASRRLTQYGPNEIAREKPPSVWSIAVGQLRDPMNIMLIAVTVVSLLISQFSTAVIVAFLILLNLSLGTRQELKARESVDALAKMQVPESRVVRDDAVRLVPAVELVPGDIVQLEAGDIVPADGRLVRAATLETQESALTGESAPVSKDAQALLPDDVGLADRSNMVYQNTSVTRGTATVVITATGMQTQMGQIASMLTSVTRTRSPLQKELGALTGVLAIIAWSAVAFIFVVGLIRGIPGKELLLLGTAMAISAIPTGLPAFVSGLLSMGAKELAESKAVVKNLTDVETLGATSAINTDKTGTLTLNQMMVSVLFVDGSWFPVEGEGYRKTGQIRSVAGVPVPDLTRLALGLSLDSHGRRRRQRRGRSHGSRARRARRQARRRRRGNSSGLSPTRRSSVRLGVQIHGHVPPGHRGRERAHDRARQGGTGRRARPVQPLRWPAERCGRAD